MTVKAIYFVALQLKKLNNSEGDVMKGVILFVLMSVFNIRLHCNMRKVLDNDQ